MEIFKAHQVWFSSDFHLGHKNVIRFDNRPFTTIEEMDDAIINNINALVKEDDHFFYLGDFTFYNDPKKINSLLDRIVCKNIYYIKGNHDKALYKYDITKRFKWTRELTEIYVEESDGKRQGIVLCHYAMRVWDKSHHGTWHLYGHSHGSLPDDPNSLSFDIGCNCWSYEPINYATIKKRMGTKTFKPIDHHKPEEAKKE